MIETTPLPRQSAYTAFWLFRARDTRPHWSDEEREEACRDIHDVIAKSSPGIELRGAYVTSGLTAGVELILWLIADDAAAFQKLGTSLRRSPLDQAMTFEKIYLGVASASQYDPNHGPAFLRGLPPKQYLSVYPFTKTPAWSTSSRASSPTPSVRLALQTRSSSSRSKTMIRPSSSRWSSASAPPRSA